MYMSYSSVLPKNLVHQEARDVRSSQDFVPDKIYIRKRTPMTYLQKPQVAFPLKVANIVNAPLKLTNKLIGKIGGEIGTIGGSVVGVTAGATTGMLVSGTMTGLVGGGIGLAFGGGLPVILGGIGGLLIGGGAGGITNGIKGFTKGASLGEKIGRNISQFPLEVMQKAIETIAKAPISLYDKIKS